MISIEQFNTFSYEDKNVYIKELEKSYIPAAINQLYTVNIGSDSIYEPSTISINLNPLATQEKLDSIRDYFNVEKTNDNQLSKMKELLSDVAELDLILEPLFSGMGIKYNLAIAGGAVRDLLLGKSEEIKDLDVVLSINSDHYERWHSNQDKYNRNYIMEDPDTISRLKKSGIPPFIYNQSKGTTEVDQFIFHVISEIIKKTLPPNKEYEPRNKTEYVEKDIRILQSGYFNTFLRGVIKLEDKRFNHPIDILLSTTTIPKYIESFDFNICKSFLQLDNYRLSLLQDNLKNMTNEKLQQYFKKIEFGKGFLDDVMNKTLTMDAEGFDIDAVETSLLKHYPRLKAKYPEYKFNYIELEPPKGNNPFLPNQVEVFNQVNTYIKTFINYDKLNNKLMEKEESKEIKNAIKKKNKI